MRVRALGLQAQLYDGEVFNPELTLPGRFDFAFVLVYLAPLFLIALLHDLLSGEREAGRLKLLLVLQKRGGAIWQRRALLRAGYVGGAHACFADAGTCCHQPIRAGESRYRPYACAAAERPRCGGIAARRDHGKILRSSP